MGITERREREKTERRKNILSCARELIILHGVERVSMEDVAKKAELSKATVYLYFSGKEDLLNEICEESAKGFLEHFKPLLETCSTGLETLKCLWRYYVEMFGSSDEMILIFKVHSFLDSSVGSFLQEQGKSPYIDAILEAVKNIIDRCKAEGIFDPHLDSAMATRLLLAMFSTIVEKAARIPQEMRKSPAVIEEMASSFQIIIRGFAKEGIDYTRLDITSRNN